MGFNTQVVVKHLKYMRCGSGRNGALKALRGIRVPGYGGVWGVTGYPLVESKEFLTVIALVRRLRLCEESSTECHQKGENTKSGVLLCARHCAGP